MLFIVCAVNAQTEFSVPTPTMDQKLNMAEMLYNNTVLTLITVAKSEGITAEELGKKCGAVFVPVWDENGGFEPFVNFLLNRLACEADDVQIIEQSNEKLVVTVSSMYKPLEDQGVLFGSSVEEYTAFFNAIHREIAVHYGRSFEMTWGEEGYKIEISK
jgi:hypothetical protein